MVKRTQTTAAVSDTFLRSLCGRAPEAKRLPSSLGHRLGTIGGHGIFILAIALLAFIWVVAPTKVLATDGEGYQPDPRWSNNDGTVATSPQAWDRRGFLEATNDDSSDSSRAADVPDSRDPNNAPDPAAPEPSGTASPTDSTTNNDVTAIDPSATTDDPSATTNASVDAASVTPAITVQPSGQTILPSLVTALMATATSSSQVTLRWNSSTDTGGLGLAGYLVYRDGILVGTTTATVFADTTVAPNTSYCYTIIAYDVGSNNALASAENCITTPPAAQGNPSAPGFYVDYSTGSDSNPGTNAAAPWKHCPGDSAATGTAGSTLLNFGDTVYFKGGVQYVLVGDGNPIYQTGIALNWSGSASNPITYDGNSAGAWGTGRAIFTDNYSSNFIAAFYVYGAVSNLVFNNLEIGPMGGSAALPADPGTGVPSQNGYGIFVNGMARGVTVENCYFHNLGYTYNTIPMDGESVASSDSRDCSSGVEVHGAIGLVVTNCEFTHVHTGIEFGWNQDSSNVTFVANYLHDFMVWGIDFGAIQGNLDYLSVNGNTFSGMGWAYSPPYWSGYENKPATCPTCFVGPPHQDPIFFRTGNTNVTCGAHNNIYNNIFQTTHTAEVFTADIYLEYAPSVNIYNNLFDNPNAGLAFSGQSVCGNSTGILTTNSWSGGGAPPVTISYELNQGGTIRILNNTIIINTTNASESSALLVGACGCLVPPLTWPTNAFLQIENNLAYSFYNQGFDATVVLFGVVTNQYPVAQWTVDYNDWHSQNTADTWFWWNNQPGFNIHGGLAADQSVGFDAHGMTNDPAFVSLAYGSSTNSLLNNYALQASSPCISAGVNLSSLNLPGLGTGINGVLRPTTNQWDIGAYQH